MSVSSIHKRQIICALAASAALLLPSLARAQQAVDTAYTAQIRKDLEDPRITTELVDYLPYSATVPTPLKVLGHIIGAPGDLDRSADIYKYFDALAKASPRVKVWRIGKTEEGRDQFMLIVSSQENIKNLDRYKAISQQLAHAEGLTDQQARALAAEGKTIVWIDGGLHATEVVGAHQLIETAYQLLSRTDPETVNILDKVIVLMTHANPDGQELVSSWYMRNPNPEKRSLEQVPRLWE